MFLLPGFDGWAPMTHLCQPQLRKQPHTFRFVHAGGRTSYKGDRKISFVSYHSRAISMTIVRAGAWKLHDTAQKSKGRLCGKRAGSPAALA